MSIIYLLLIAGGCVFMSNAQDIITAVQREPLILDFKYDGPTVDYTYTKDGQLLIANKLRTFQKLGKLFFTRVVAADSGTYRLVAENFNKEITVHVQRTGHAQDNARMSASIALLKAIGLHESKQLLIDTFTSKGNAPVTPNPSQIIRKFWHVLSEHGAKQARARLLVESIIQSAIKSMDADHDISEMMSAETMTSVMDFAGCDKATDLYNCSTSTIDKFRTADSTCNNRDNPLWGAANTAFSRVHPAQYEDGIQSPVGFDQLRKGRAFRPPWPSAREVSRIIVRDLPPRAPQSHLFAVWSQQIAHDMGRMGEFETNACEETCNLDELSPFCFPVLVNPRDSAFGKFGPNRGQCLPLTRSVGECIQSEGNNTLDMARQQLNQVTHYLDGSAIYGSTAFETTILRQFVGGLMKISGRIESIKGHPPFTPIPTAQGLPAFAFGDPRGNAITPLMTVQTIMIREHNRLARQFAVINPCWDDERIFQEARKIVSSLVQIISYEEFLRTLYGSQYNKYIGPYPGYDPSVDATISNEFDNAAFRFAHSMISDSFQRLDSEGNSLPIGPLGLRESFLNSLQYFISGGTDPLLRGLMQDRSRAADIFYTRVFTTQLFAPSDNSLGHDLASRDIQRGRGHGLASYRVYEEFCRNKYNVQPRFATTTIERQLRYVYGNEGFQNGIDLWTGSQAEKPLEGSSIGPTLSCIMGMTFSNVRNGDRFWWENPDVFTDDQRASLAGIRLSKLICDNADNIPMIKRDVFTPGGQPVSCSSLPSLDISLWKDNACSI